MQRSMRGITHSQAVAFCLALFHKLTKSEQKDFELYILAIQEWGGLFKVCAHMYRILVSKITFLQSSSNKTFLLVYILTLSCKFGEYNKAEGQSYSNKPHMLW